MNARARRSHASVGHVADLVEAPTPAFTKVALLVTVAITSLTLGAFLATHSPPRDARGTAAYLCVLSALFFIRVAGQLLVRLRSPSWLPPTEQWALTPYRVLLPTQIGILVLMSWIDADFVRGEGSWASPRPALGIAVRWFALAYASVMALRFVVRMIRRPEQRWFGGTIPIVFHWVLAAWLFVFGSFHASH